MEGWKDSLSEPGFSGWTGKTGEEGWKNGRMVCLNQDFQDLQEGQDKSLSEPGFTGFTG